MKLKVSQVSQIPIYEQIESQIREQIFSGTLKAGEQLPSIRALARELQIGIITAKRAYDDLCCENILTSRQGKGVFVAEMDMEHLKQLKRDRLRTELKRICRYGAEAGFTEAEVEGVLKEVWEEETR